MMFVNQAQEFFLKAQTKFLQLQSDQTSQSLHYDNFKSLLYTIYNGMEDISFDQNLIPERVKNLRRSTISALMNAHILPNVWDKGWKIDQITKDSYLASKNGVRFNFLRSCYQVRAINSKNDNVKLGDYVEIFQPAYIAGLSPGFLIFRGNISLDFIVNSRIYINVDQENILIFIKQISKIFEELNIPYEAKVNVDVHANVRRDSAVLYFDSKDCRKVLQGLYEVIKIVPVREEIPLFTKLLCRGVSLAANPEDGTSFGQYIVNLLVEVITLDDIIHQSPDELTANFKNHLRLKNIDPDNLWSLGKNSELYNQINLSNFTNKYW